MDVPLTIKQENQWFHCIFHVIWTNENVKHYAGVMGKLRKMDQSHMADAERTMTAIRPSIELLLDCIRMKKRMGFCSLSGREANILLQYLKTFLMSSGWLMSQIIASLKMGLRLTVCPAKRT